MRTFQKWLFTVAILLPVAVGLLSAGNSVVGAQNGGPADSPPINDRCLRCHLDADDVIQFGDGEERPVMFDLAAYNASQHGAENPSANLACYDCHGVKDYPHNTELPETAHDLRLEMNAECERCHQPQHEQRRDSMHGIEMPEELPPGIVNEDAKPALCIDCHGYHDVPQPGEPREAISLICSQCHTEIFETYRASVHGEALLQESNPDVPTCGDCHDVHSVADPTTSLARLRSPLLCAHCHANASLMAEYEISTNVFNSYLADFHGTTVTLFEHQAPEAEVNKAVCYDCHGAHDIRAINDPESSVIHENLLETCQKCHPDATPNFPAAWTSHYEPSPDTYSLVYYVDLFYQIFIPGVLGIFVILIIPDAGRRLFNRLAGRK